LISEAIRNAQKLSGKKSVVGADVRRGLESLNLTDARLKEIGLGGFAAPISGINCSDHNGHGSAFVQQWDGAKWAKISDWLSPMKDKVEPLIKEAAESYVSKATGWPKRTEACDKSS
jgi:branched-chain amino acid transport system substrate-binding protein